MVRNRVKMLKVHTAKRQSKAQEETRVRDKWYKESSIYSPLGERERADNYFLKRRSLAASLCADSGGAVYVYISRYTCGPILSYIYILCLTLRFFGIICSLTLSARNQAHCIQERSRALVYTYAGGWRNRMFGLSALGGLRVAAVCVYIHFGWYVFSLQLCDAAHTHTHTFVNCRPFNLWQRDRREEHRSYPRGGSYNWPSLPAAAAAKVSKRSRCAKRKTTKSQNIPLRAVYGRTKNQLTLSRV